MYSIKLLEQNDGDMYMEHALDVHKTQDRP